MVCEERMDGKIRPPRGKNIPILPLYILDNPSVYFKQGKVKTFIWQGEPCWPVSGGTKWRNIMNAGRMRFSETSSPISAIKGTFESSERITALPWGFDFWSPCWHGSRSRRHGCSLQSLRPLFLFELKTRSMISDWKGMTYRACRDHDGSIGYRRRGWEGLGPWEPW